MAQAPTAEQVSKVQLETQKEIDKKIKAQKKLGKGFEIHDAGVIPEKVWKSLKDKNS